VPDAAVPTTRSSLYDRRPPLRQLRDNRAEDRAARPPGRHGVLVGAFLSALRGPLQDLAKPPQKRLRQQDPLRGNQSGPRSFVLLRLAVERQVRFRSQATLASLSEEPLSIEILDGLQNLMPHGIVQRFQMEFSTLGDAYKLAELEPETGLGLIRLNAIPVDRAEPSEALRATTVWSYGLEPTARLLSTVQLDRFRRLGEVEQEGEVRDDAVPTSSRPASISRGTSAGLGTSWPDVDQDAADTSDCSRCCGRAATSAGYRAGCGARYARAGQSGRERRRSAGERGRAQPVAAFLERSLQRHAGRRAGSRILDLAR